MKKKFLVGTMGLVLGLGVLTGCGGNGNTGNKVSIVGSTTIAEPMESIVEAYKQENPDLNLEVQGNGSSAGIKAASDGTAEIGMTSRELSASEKNLGLTETVIAYDGIAVVVNPTNTAKGLTTEQLKGIYEGKITNWSEVGGNNQDIIVVTREAGSGTRGAFEELVGLLDENKASTIAETALVSEGTGAIMATVASKENAIGFVSLGYVDDTVGTVAIDGVEPLVETVKEGSYKLSRPLILVTKEGVSDQANAVLSFIVGDKGQEIISEKYISIQ